MVDLKYRFDNWNELNGFEKAGTIMFLIGTILTFVGALGLVLGILIFLWALFG